MSDSLITKRALSQALIELCESKRFDKINIADVTSHCGLKRQTFYYHFTDKYDLLQWTYEQDALINLLNGIKIENWDKHVLNMLNQIVRNQKFYHNTVTADQSILNTCFCNITRGLFQDLFTRLDNKKLVCQEDKEFYSHFFSYGCGGVLLTWIQAGCFESAEEVAAKMARLAKDTQFLASQLQRN